MAAGLNQIVARQSKMAIKNLQITELKNTHINPAVFIKVKVKSLSRYQTVCDLWTVAHQAFL